MLVEVLVSFCNLRSVPGRPALGLLDSIAMTFQVLKLPEGVPHGIGMMGLAVSSRYVFVGLQVSGGVKSAFSAPGLLIFDRNDFSLVHHYVFQLVKDVHSFCLSKNEQHLYVVSTGTDEVIEVSLDGAVVTGEQQYWRPEPGGAFEDVFHINCIYEWNGDLVVSGFGKKADTEEWNSARNGFICNITKNLILSIGIEHPHSFADLDDKLAYCASRKRSVCVVDDKLEVVLPGYARGLCNVSNKLFAGTSASRKVSKSTGRLNKSLGIDGGDCSISRINPDNFEIEATVSLRNYAEEIYELLAVNNTENWPKLEESFCPLEDAWIQQCENAIAQLNAIVKKTDTVILVEDNLWPAIEPATFKRLHFLERDGAFWGVPPDSMGAIQEFESMRKEQGVRFIAFGWPSFWWFDHYGTFTTHLRENYCCILDNDHLVVFDLINRSHG